MFFKVPAHLVYLLFNYFHYNKPTEYVKRFIHSPTDNKPSQKRPLKNKKDPERKKTHEKITPRKNEALSNKERPRRKIRKKNNYNNRILLALPDLQKKSQNR